MSAVMEIGRWIETEQYQGQVEPYDIAAQPQANTESAGNRVGELSGDSRMSNIIN